MQDRGLKVGPLYTRPNFMLLAIAFVVRDVSNSFFCALSAVILAPLILSGLVWGVLVPAWPHARLAVATLPSRFGGFGTKVLRRQKCFLAR